jgi:hypothetical protein
VKKGQVQFLTTKAGVISIQILLVQAVDLLANISKKKTFLIRMIKWGVQFQ